MIRHYSYMHQAIFTTIMVVAAFTICEYGKNAFRRSVLESLLRSRASIMVKLDLQPTLQDAYGTEELVIFCRDWDRKTNSNICQEIREHLKLQESLAQQYELAKLICGVPIASQPINSSLNWEDVRVLVRNQQKCYLSNMKILNKTLKELNNT